MDYKTLSNGVKIPSIGYGTYKTPAGEVCVDGVRKAVETGYRLIDTAAFYGNEESVKDGLIDSKVCRNDIFITTKLWNDDHGYDNALRAFEKSVKNLGLDYLDLYLIHWPIPLAHRDDWQKTVKETWKAFERLYDEKAIRCIGVSNFQERHLEYLLNNCNVAPMVDQIVIHVGYPKRALSITARQKTSRLRRGRPLQRARRLRFPS